MFLCCSLVRVILVLLSLLFVAVVNQHLARCIITRLGFVKNVGVVNQKEHAKYIGFSQWPLGISRFFCREFLGSLQFPLAKTNLTRQDWTLQFLLLPCFCSMLVGRRGFRVACREDFLTPVIDWLHTERVSLWSGVSAGFSCQKIRRRIPS